MLTFVGVEFDTDLMILRLPMDKWSELKMNILDVLACEKVTLETLQSLPGSLQFACRVVQPGRVFCRRLIDATKGVKISHYRIRVWVSMKEDLKSWLEFLREYNGVTAMPDRWWTTHETLEPSLIVRGVQTRVLAYTLRVIGRLPLGQMTGKGHPSFETSRFWRFFQ